MGGCVLGVLLGEEDPNRAKRCRHSNETESKKKLKKNLLKAK